MKQVIKVEGRPRMLLRYGIALLASVVALSIIEALNPVVGFIPILLLGAVVVVQRYAGSRPAILAISICTAMSLRFLGTHPYPDVRAHKLSEVIIFPIVAGGSIYLLETHRRQKRVVHEQSVELSSLLNSMTEGVFVFDREGIIMEANGAAEQLCGQTRDVLLGAHYTEIAKHLRVHRGEVPLTIAEMGVDRALRGEIVQNESRTYTRPQDSAPVEAVISATPLRVGKGRVNGALLVVHDVTELAHLQRRVADTERHLAIGQMASGLAHDFNNVLNTITQATALLRLNPDQGVQERQRYLIMIDRAARTGAEIIRRVRDYVRGGVGERAAVDVARVLREAIDLAEPMWRTQKRIDVETRLDPVSPVWANTADLRRVFTNLVINAIQAMPHGGTLRLESQERDGTVVIRVSDTGQGIPPEVQKRIFLPYFTTKASGTGLGLSTAQKILLASGGSIEFTSEPGVGTTFTVQLPAMQPELAKVA